MEPPMAQVVFDTYGPVGLALLVAGYVTYKLGKYLIDESMKRLDTLTDQLNVNTKKQTILAENNAKHMSMLVRAMTELAISICEATPGLKASDLDFSFIDRGELRKREE